MPSTENDVCNHVKVFIRVRPENSREQNGRHHKVVHVVDKHMLVFDPKVDEINYFYGCKVKHRDLNKRKNKDLQFVFDRVFGGDSSQSDIFEETKSILESVFNGYNCTVFAYGTTGSGKTHTMLGSPGQPGVMYRTMKELYNRIEQLKDEKCCDVAVSYLEVYNEEVRDLLTNSRSLAVREDAQSGVIVQGLTLHKPTSSKQLLQMLDYGNKNRTQHPTDVNSNSSRSHAVFQRKNQHIPYRNSKLTRLLKDSLGGNCQTIMIAAISPSSLFYEDTYNTLKYANRAKDIKSSIKSNVLNLNNHVGKYAKICEEQRKEIMELKEKLKAYESEKLLVHNNHGRNIMAGSNSKENEIKRFEQVLENIFSNRQKIRITCLDLELKLKEMELKMYYYQKYQQHAKLLSCEHVTEKASCKHERRLAALITQHKHIQQKTETAEKMLEENDNWLHRVENEMCLLGQNGKMPQVLNQDLQCSHLKMEVMDLKRQIQHMNQLLSLQKPENRRTEKLINTLLPAFCQQYQTMKEAGLASAAAEDAFVQVEQLVQQEKGITWEDQIMKLPEQLSDGQLNISSIMNYSQLTYCQAAPCSSKRTPSRSQQEMTVKVKKDKSPHQLKPAAESKENLLSMGEAGTVSTYRSSRRRLEQSLLTCSDLNSSTVQNSSLAQLDDSLAKEGLARIHYTPENCKSQIMQVSCQLPISKQELQTADCHREEERKNLSDTENSVSKMSENLINVTYNLGECSQFVKDTRVQHSFVNETNCNKAVTGYNASYKHSKNHRSFLQRLGLPSLLSSNATNSKPSYMALTAATRKKRKSESFLGQGDDNAAKRVRQNMPTVKEPTGVLLPGRSQNRRGEYLARRKRISKEGLIYKGLSSNKDNGRRAKSMQHI
ncbi:kinesin-like protein KIF18A isoform X2 [Scyliorhinus torazame]|uniref:kinesin-like protein KIF18A isoform X2 n=1 Tax=Scyliorhinus torazame TaxID=75743 RepID=UPI003B5A59D9